MHISSSLVVAPYCVMSATRVNGFTLSALHADRRSRPVLHAAGDMRSPDSHNTTSPFAAANADINFGAFNFAPVTRELTHTQLTITGEIPAGLKGVYIRNGPNPHPNTQNHLFLGKGMLHGVWIENQLAVAYRNRYVRLLANGFMSGLSNVAVIHFDNTTLSLGDIGVPIEINPANLATAGRFRFNDSDLLSNVAAHAKVDHRGGVHFFGYNPTAQPYLRYLYVRNGAVEKAEPIELTGPKMVHDIAVTERHLIFFDLPVTFSLASALNSLLKQIAGGGQDIPFAWDPETKSRIGVMPREGKPQDIRWFDIDPCFIFHTVNAYEDADSILLDVVRYERFMLNGSHDLSEPAHLARFSLNMTDTTSELAILDKHFIEFPKINEAYLGKPHRYVYCLTSTLPDGSRSGSRFTGLIKYDLQKNQYQRFSFPEHYIASEFSFVPTPSSQAEDDGYLIGYMYNQESGTSSLWILDAKQLLTPSHESKALAIIELGVRVPNGFHGTWIPDVSFFDESTQSRL